MYYNKKIRCLQKGKKRRVSTMKKLVFEEVTENELFADYTADCSGGRSDCCTRVCTRQGDDNYIPATEEEWGRFLDLEGGVIQY